MGGGQSPPFQLFQYLPPCPPAVRLLKFSLDSGATQFLLCLTSFESGFSHAHPRQPTAEGSLKFLRGIKASTQSFTFNNLPSAFGLISFRKCWP